MPSIQKLYNIYQCHPSVSTDSRTIEMGSLFFALKGGGFDGNQYAETALMAGAAYAIVDDPSVVAGDRYLLVEDVLSSLQQLAHYHRRQLNIPVLAITGSNGKTTTKELVASVLAQNFRTHFTQGNYNNHIGVPLTLLAMPIATEIAVIEMGANHQGEIAALCEIAAPTHGLITNIGQAHLEGFGGVEGVKKGKTELYRYLDKHEGTAFVNEDADFLAELLPPTAKKISYRTAPVAKATNKAINLELVQDQPHIELRYSTDEEEVLVSSTLMGRHNVENIKTAIGVGHYFGVPAQKIAQAIAAYQPTNNRSQRTHWRGHTVYLDAYNANPTSMRASLSAFFSQVSQPPILILGDMLELGAESKALHQALADWLGGQDWKQLLVVGAEFAKVALPEGAQHFQNTAALRDWWESTSMDTNPIFIKGSRGIALEGLLKL